MRCNSSQHVGGKGCSDCQLNCTNARCCGSPEQEELLARGMGLWRRLGRVDLGEGQRVQGGVVLEGEWLEAQRVWGPDQCCAMNRRGPGACDDTGFKNWSPSLPLRQSGPSGTWAGLLPPPPSRSMWVSGWCLSTEQANGLIPLAVGPGALGMCAQGVGVSMREPLCTHWEGAAALGPSLGCPHAAEWPLSGPELSWSLR